MGHLAAINQLITTHFSTEYSEPQPTTESIPRKCPQEGNHIHEGYFIPTAPAFSQRLRASAGLGMTMGGGSDKGENTFFREIDGVCHFFFCLFLQTRVFKSHASISVFLNLPALGMTSFAFSICATSASHFRCTPSCLWLPSDTIQFENTPQFLNGEVNWSTGCYFFYIIINGIFPGLLSVRADYRLS